MPVTALSVGEGLGKLFNGIATKNRAAATAAELERTRPKFQISQQSENELHLNESELVNGMGAKAERSYNESADKGLSSSLATILKGGGNVNSVGDLYGADDSGRQRIVQLQESSRLANIQKLMDSQRNMASEEQKAFEFNQWRPWADKTQANAVQRESADAGISSGMDGIGSTLSKFGQNKQESNMFQKYLDAQKSKGDDGDTSEA